MLKVLWLRIVQFEKIYEKKLLNWNYNDKLSPSLSNTKTAKIVEKYLEDRNGTE